MLLNLIFMRAIAGNEVIYIINSSYEEQRQDKYLGQDQNIYLPLCDKSHLSQHPCNISYGPLVILNNIVTIVTENH